MVESEAVVSVEFTGVTVTWVEAIDEEWMMVFPEALVVLSREGGAQLNVVDLIVGDVSLSVNLPSISPVSLACRSIMATAFLASATPWSVSAL